MSWLLLGELRRIIKRPIDAVGSKFQLQILASEVMKSGEVRESIFTIGTDLPSKYESFIGKEIVLEASPWAKKDGSLGISVSDGANVQLAGDLLDTRA
jgi:hypothetical protein